MYAMISDEEVAQLIEGFRMRVINVYGKWFSLWIYCKRLFDLERRRNRLFIGITIRTTDSQNIKMYRNALQIDTFMGYKMELRECFPSLRSKASIFNAFKVHRNAHDLRFEGISKIQKHFTDRAVGNSSNCAGGHSIGHWQQCHRILFETKIFHEKRMKIGRDIIENGLVSLT